MCFLMSATQLLFASMLFLQMTKDFEMSPIKLVHCFAMKLLCCFFMHMAISSDLKKTMDLMSYLKNPTVVEHILAKRYLAFFLLQCKYVTAIAIESLHILVQASIRE